MIEELIPLNATLQMLSKTENYTIKQRKKILPEDQNRIKMDLFAQKTAKNDNLSRFFELMQGQDEFLGLYQFGNRLNFVPQTKLSLYSHLSSTNFGKKYTWTLPI